MKRKIRIVKSHPNSGYFNNTVLEVDEIEYESIIKYNDVIDVEETPIVTPTPKLKRSKKVK